MDEDAGNLPGIRIVSPEPHKRRFGDPASKSAYLDAYLACIKTGPTPALCLVGPYADSPAFSAANSARNELTRHKEDLDHIRLHNTGRSFLGLGALAASIACVRLTREQAMTWLDEGATGTSMWLVARTEQVVNQQHGPAIKLDPC